MTTRRFKITSVTTLALALLVCMTVSTQAEIYLGGQVGWNLPQDFSNVQGTGAGSGITLSDLELDEMVVFGGKFGGYLPSSVDWLGGEIEVYQTDSDIKQQQVTISAPILGINTSGTLNAIDLAITTVAFNLLVRYPGEIFQPYAGVGAGINIARLSGGGVARETSVDPTLNLLAGVRAFVTKNVALFGEYKHNRGTFEFSNNLVEGDYRTNMVLGGISYHFK